MSFDSSAVFGIALADTLKFRFDPAEDVILADMKNEHVSIKAVLRRME